MNEKANVIAFCDKHNNLLAMIDLETFEAVECKGYKILTNLDNELVKIKGTKDRFYLNDNLADLFHIYTGVKK